MDQNISTSIILVASLIIFFSYSTSTYVSIQALSEKENRIDEIAEEAQKLAQKETEKRQEYNVFLQYKEDFENMLPFGRDDARTLMIINSMANTHNIVITDVNINEGSYMSGARRASTSVGVRQVIKTVNLQFNATYENFSKFLTSLEKSRRIFDVVAINFVSSSARVYSFEMAIHTYRIEN